MHSLPFIRAGLGWGKIRTLLLILPIILILAIASCTPQQNTSSSGDIVIGSKNFTEQVILGELLAQQIENTTKLKVQRRLNLGGTFICHKGLQSGQLDAYVEYTGTAFTAILNQKTITNPQQVYQQVKQQYAKQFNLAVTQPLGFNNTFAMIIRGSDAQRLQIKTLSEASKYTPQWQAGVGYEFLERADGFPGLAKTYNFKFAKPPQVMDLGLMYRALVNQKVDLVAGNSTDGQIQTLKLLVLKDDKNYFPPYQAVPVVRQETLKKYPKLQSAFNQLEGLISESDMRQMNYQVDGEFRKVEDVVREFLQSKNLSKK